MSNMSYCRFENTSGDLHDCVITLQNALEDGVGAEEFIKKLSSDHERRGFKELRDLCEEFVDRFDELKGEHNE